MLYLFLSDFELFLKNFANDFLKNPNLIAGLGIKELKLKSYSAFDPPVRLGPDLTVKIC